MPLLVAGICAIPAFAQAGTPYISASTGLALLNNSSEDGVNDAVKYNTGYLVNGAIGMKCDYSRFEAEIGYQNNSVDTYLGNNDNRNARVAMTTLMANGYLDYNMKNSDVSPYVMAGLGASNVTLKNDFSSDSDTSFAWQLGAGVGIKASEKVTVDVGYRYLSPSDISVSGFKYSLASSNILVGLRCSF